MVIKPLRVPSFAFSESGARGAAPLVNRVRRWGDPTFVLDLLRSLVSYWTAERHSFNTASPRAAWGSKSAIRASMDTLPS